MMMGVTVAMNTMMTMVLNLPSSVRGGDELIHLPASHLPPTLTDEPSLWRRKSDNMPPSPPPQQILTQLLTATAPRSICVIGTMFYTPAEH